MLTPILEKAILSGKGSLKTFGIGGMGKNVLPVPDDRFIIIVNILSFPHFPDANTDLDNGPLSTLNRCVYQLNVNTQSRQWHFPLRKAFSININDNNPQPDTFPLAGFGNAENIDTYLVCQSGVEFVFLSPGDKGLKSLSQGVTNSNSSGVQPSTGAGRDGIPDSLPQDLVMQQTFSNSIFMRQNEFETAGLPGGIDRIYNNYQIGMDDQSRYAQKSLSLNEQLEENWQHPLGLVQYVEVFGLPTDLQ
jgi:hypothetical protein